MIPRLGKQGSSFKGAAAYYLHDKGHAATAERVAFTHTENLWTNEPDQAWRTMAYTAGSADFLKRQAGERTTGRKSEKPVFHFSLSWHPEQKPAQETMIEAARKALEHMGIGDRQALFVAHRDEPQPHIHVIVNLVHPETGRTASPSYTKEKLSRWAEKYEKEHGKIYCRRRVENNLKRDFEQAHRRAGADTAKAGYPRHKEQTSEERRAEITQLYRSADSGKAFAAALKSKGYQLAQGRRPVIIDRDGNSHSLFRQLDGVKAREARAKLADYRLPEVFEGRQRQQDDQARAARRREKKQPETIDRDAQDREWQESIITAGIEADRAKRPAKPRPGSLRAQEEALRRQTQDAEHDRQWRALYQERNQARKRANAVLFKAYGESEKTLQADLDALVKKQEKAGWLSKLTGAYKRREGEIEAKRLGLANIEMRRKSEMDEIDRQTAEKRERLIEQQKAARTYLDKEYGPDRERGQKIKARQEAQQEWQQKRREPVPEPVKEIVPDSAPSPSPAPSVPAQDFGKAVAAEQDRQRKLAEEFAERQARYVAQAQERNRRPAPERGRDSGPEREL